VSGKAKLNELVRQDLPQLEGGSFSGGGVCAGSIQSSGQNLGTTSAHHPFVGDDSRNSGKASTRQTSSRNRGSPVAAGVVVSHAANDETMVTYIISGCLYKDLDGQLAPAPWLLRQVSLLNGGQMDDTSRSMKPICLQTPKGSSPLTSGNDCTRRFLSAP